MTSTGRGTISREELQEKLEAGAPFFLFEVLPEPYYRKHHLPTARHMPPNEIAETAERVVPDKDADIVLYCWDDH
jgi:rhodanese-related sulfurtransferase